MQPVAGARICSQEHEEDIERLMLSGHPERHVKAPTITRVAQMGLHRTRVKTCSVDEKASTLLRRWDRD